MKEGGQQIGFWNVTIKEGVAAFCGFRFDPGGVAWTTGRRQMFCVVLAGGVAEVGEPAKFRQEFIVAGFFPELDIGEHGAKFLISFFRQK